MGMEGVVKGGNVVITEEGQGLHLVGWGRGVSVNKGTLLYTYIIISWFICFIVWLPWLVYWIHKSKGQICFCCIDKCISQACYSNCPITSVAFSSGHFLTPVTCTFHCRSAVALCKAAICCMCRLIPAVGGDNHLRLGHAVFSKERRSKRSAGTGDASKTSAWMRCVSCLPPSTG